MAVDDRNVGVEPLARKDGEHTAAANDQIGRLVTSRHGQSSSEVGHAARYPAGTGLSEGLPQK
jgi:hypothetical protein